MHLARLVLALVATMLFTIRSAQAQFSGSTASADAQGKTQSASSDEWQFQFSPYLFLGSVKGTTGIGNFTTEVDVPFRDLIDELNFGFMGVLEARKNKFIFLTDTLYMNLADSGALAGPLFSSAHADFKLFIFDPEVGYRLAGGEAASLDVLGGIRYWHLRTRLEFRPGLLPGTEVERSKNWVDAVGGLRGRAHLSPRWFLIGKGDLGGGGSDFTYQLFGGIGANVGSRASLILGYRHLKADYDADGFLFDMAIKGPVLGFSIRF